MAGCERDHAARRRRTNGVRQDGGLYDAVFALVGNSAVARCELSDKGRELVNYFCRWALAADPHWPDVGAEDGARIFDIEGDRMSGLGVSPEGIRQAQSRIAAVFRNSPQFVAEALADRVGFAPLLKVETVNPIRSFKGRGADLVAAAAKPGETLVCASAGNLGQGLAYAGRSRGMQVKVYAAASVPPLKLQRMRSLGADLVAVDGDFDDACREAREAARRGGWRLVVDGESRELAEGAGTLAVELTGESHSIEYVFVPVGNGSLACGVGSWFKFARPHTKVIAVGAAGAPAMEHAWRTGELCVGPPTSTVAEGLAARVPVSQAVHTMQEVVDDFLLVDDEQLFTAMRLLLDHCGLVAEPSGAAALAGALTMAEELVGSTVALPIGGANIDRCTLTHLTGKSEGEQGER